MGDGHLVGKPLRLLPGALRIALCFVELRVACLLREVSIVYIQNRVVEYRSELLSLTMSEECVFWEIMIE